MRALVLEDFGRMVVAEVPDVEPGADEVKIAVAGTGICGSDLHGYTGANGRRVPGQVMGHEAVGRIAQLGSLVHGELRVGQVVTFNPMVIPAADAEAFRGREQHHPDRYVIGVKPTLTAAFADFVVVPARNVVVLPESIPIEHGALIEPLAVAVHAVRRVGARRGQHVLVIGGGPIGQSIVIALQMAGVTEIVVSEPDTRRRTLLAELGAETVDPASGPLQQSVQEHFGGLADVTLDAVGLSRTVADALNATAFGGSVCLVGMGSPTLDLDAFRVSTEERAIIGSFAYTTDDFRDAATYLVNSPAAAATLISRQVTLDEAPDAFASLARGDGTAGKVIVRFDR